MKVRFSNLLDSTSKPGVLAVLCILVLLLAVPFAVRAQVTTAAVRGTVSDEQGAALAGAEVTITNVETGFSRTTTAGSDGVYNFPDLPLGLFKIRATHTGFKSAEQTGITLHVNDSLVINISLKVGAVSESVTVEASPIAVETTHGELTGLVQAAQVADLPLNGRNFMQLVTTQPGVAAGPQFSAFDKGLKGGSDLSISGGAVDANLWLVDGASNNDVGSNRTILIFPSIDAIEELKIERNSYGPEFGQSAGGQVSMITKSGGNAFHGSVFYFGRNDKLDAFDTFLKSGCLAAGNPCVKNELRRNDYGFSIGGPIKKDKIFFFYSEEWNKMIQGQTTTARVPTTAEKAGDFSAIRACPNAVSQLGWPSVAGSNPAVARDLQLPQGAPANTFSAPNVFSAGALSPAAQVILQAYPTPTDPNPCARNNFVHSFGVPTNWREENVRGDINLTSSLRAMMRFTNDSWQLGPPDGGFGWGNNALGPIGEYWTQPGRVVVGRLSKTIGTTMVNDFTFSYSANRITITPAGTDPTLNQKLNDTIPTFFPLSGKLYGDKGPSVWINCCGLPSVWTIAPWQNQEDLYNWQDDFSKAMGRHTMKFGAVYSRNYKAEQAANGEFGTLGGAVGYNGNNGSAFQTLFGIADLELLNMGMGWAETQTIFKVRNVWHNVEAYAQDNFRLTSRLTLNYGIRWTYLGPVYLSDNKFTLFNPSAYQASLGTDPCNGLVYAPGIGSNPCTAAGALGGVAGPNNALMNKNYRGFAPRLSLAWDPTGQGKWAVRSGVGQFYNRDRLWPLQLAGNNPPFNGSFVGLGPNGGHNARYLDNTNPLAVCGTGPCYGTGLGTPNHGQEFADNVPNSWQWNLSVQHQLFKDARLEVGYVGSKTLHWEAITDINGVAPANRLTYVQHLLDANRTAAVSSNLRPYGPAVGDNQIIYYTHASSATYHSLQSQFISKMGSHANFQASYTYSKLLSNSQRIDTPAQNLDAYNLHNDWGPDILNHTHIFSANLVYNLPALADKSSVIRTALGGWEVTPIIAAATGPSITTLMSLGGTGAVGDPMGVGSGASTGRERANRVAGQPCRASTTDHSQWLNPAMFTMNGYQLGQVGNAGVGLCTGPGNGNMDIGLDKNFKVTERIKAQFRLEFFNLFNTPHYNYNDILNPGVNFQNPIYGDASGNVVPNVSTATQILSATPSPGSYGKINSVTQNGFRQIQYGLKFTF